LEINSKSTLLTEIAWEVCNQIGGIYTVIRSKAPSVVDYWQNNYCAVGPYFPHKANVEFEPAESWTDSFGQAAQILADQGIEIKYGTWLVSGRPRVILINPFSVFYRLGEIKYGLWEHHQIPTDQADDLQNQVLAFGYLCKLYLKQLCQVSNQKIIAHFHEWMAGVAIPEIRRENLPLATVFTTHATLLGRYLAMNDQAFYDHLPFYNWHDEAKKFNIETQVLLERAAAHGSHVFTTISQITARECESLLGRRPDALLPNGINLQRFTAIHEHQVRHQKYKEQINEFVMGHFFQSYSFDLDKTLYLYTSGRYEYRNKGFDICVEALARLNYMLKVAGSDITVVMFFITQKPYYGIDAEVLQSRTMMDEIRETCEAIQKQIGEHMFHAVAASPNMQLPDLNQFVNDYWKLRLRRNLSAWKGKHLPHIVTHELKDWDHDELLNHIKAVELINRPEDPVKIVYHPDFISSSNPLFGMDYGQFVRGCHLGVFPSYYEPWGYTPLESMASGVPSVTSDLSGFGEYVQSHLTHPAKKGVYVINRYHCEFNSSAQQLADILYQFTKQTRRERINQRNRVENSSEEFDWSFLLSYYMAAYKLALGRF